MELKGKVAIVTGASRGIGKAIAVSFAKAGATLALCATNAELLGKVAQEISSISGAKPLTFAFDIRDSKMIDDVVKKTLDTHGRIDILVNNAGATRDQLIALMPEESWDEVLSVNLKSAFLFMKAVTKPMIRARSGRIINIGSVVGLMGNAGQANYAASKAGLIGLAKTAAKELAKRNITVNTIAPGFIQTDMTRRLGEKVQSGLLEAIPAGRLGEPEDVAHLALFLASDHSSYITGQVIQVDGGMVM